MAYRTEYLAVSPLGLTPEHAAKSPGGLVINRTDCWTSPSVSDSLGPGGPDGKESACNPGDLGLIPGSGRSPGGGHGYLLQYSCLENPMQRSLAGYSPWGRTEPDTAECTFS